MKMNNMKKSKTVYLASPYGFTDSGREFMKNTMIPSIQGESFEVLNPWERFDSVSQRVEEIYSLNDIPKQNDLLKSLNTELATINEKMLDRAEVVLAILDGTDVDSGVASEIGYAYALRKKILGYRSDFRVTGDNSVAIVNLQIEYFINKSGGIIVRNIEELKKALRQAREE
jgi:nucleoside 2-deoxyribosyltransferase